MIVSKDGLLSTDKGVTDSLALMEEDGLARDGGGIALFIFFIYAVNGFAVSFYGTKALDPLHEFSTNSLSSSHMYLFVAAITALDYETAIDFYSSSLDFFFTFCAANIYDFARDKLEVEALPASTLCIGAAADMTGAFDPLLKTLGALVLQANKGF